MADDRVFIKCKYCSGWKMLLKFFTSTGSTSRDNGVMDWLDEHTECHPRCYTADLNGDPGFTLHTEDGLVDGSLEWDKQNYSPKKKPRTSEA